MREKDRLAKKQAVDAELDVDSMFRDLAMISGLMDHDESEDSEHEEEEQKVTEEKQEEESIQSLKEGYKRQPETVLKRSREDDIDELLGVHEIELKTDVGTEEENDE